MGEHCCVSDFIRKSAYSDKEPFNKAIVNLISSVLKTEVNSVKVWHDLIQFVPIFEV